MIAKEFLVKFRVLFFVKLIGFLDRFLLHTNILYPSFKENIPKDTLIFIGDTLPARIPRISKWLKRTKGVQTVLITGQTGFTGKFLTEGSFDKVIVLRNAHHIANLAQRLNFKDNVIYSFGSSMFVDLITAKLATTKKFIFDYQDLYTIYFKKNEFTASWFLEQIENEQKILSKVSHIVCHSIELLPARKAIGNIGKKDTLYFPFYCDDDVCQHNDKPISNDELHIVYCGEVQNSYRSKSLLGNVHFHYLIEKLSEQKVHFHIYPAPVTNKQFYDEYPAIAAQNNYFHFHEPVAQDKLAKELSQYHFGIIPFYSVLSQQSEEKYHYSNALKLINYIEAGIPVLVSDELCFMAWFAERYKSGRRISYSDLDKLKDMLSIDLHISLKKSLIENRGQISMSKNIDRLYDFINK